MQRYLARRLISTIVTLIGISIVVFLIVRMVPGDIVDIILGAQIDRTPELVSQMRAFFGLDVPLQIQYFRWMSKVLQGDFGLSWRAGQPVWGIIADRLPLTIELTFLAMLISVLVGIPMGVISAVRKDGWFDGISRFLSSTCLGLPNFWQGAMMILLFSKVFNWFPPLDFVSPFRDPVRNLEMLLPPAIALSTVNVATLMRLTRSSMLEVLSQDYIRTARAKGLKERVVIYRHAFMNSLVSVITVTGLMTGYLLGGAVTVEAVFTLPGVGRLLLTSIQQRDYAVTQTVLLLTSALFVLVNFLVDMSYALVNPKIRYS
jgi:peptide/nickel transport system permease protein